MAKLTYRNGDGTQIAAYVFEYDSLGRLIRSVEYGADNTITQRTEHLYDEFSRLSSQSWVIQGEPFTESYIYNDPVEDNPEAPQDGSLKQMTTASGATIDYTYDALKRLSGTTVKNSSGATIFTHAYAYKNLATSNGITQTTTQVEYHNVRNASGIVISGAKYAYDDVGNIVGIYEREPVGSNTSRRLLVAYSYDVQNQLVSETYYTYSGTSAIPSDTTTYSYTYDTAGNIQTESKDGVVTKTYTYGNSDWNDLLTEFDGDPIVYEGQSYNYSTNSVTGTPISGNPIQYHNSNSSYYMQWEQGRQLSYMAFEDEYNQYQAAFDYDLDGIRTAKYVDNVTHKYITQNGKIVRETIGTGTTAKVLDFIYDESGKPFALKYTNGTEETKTYYYVLNLQGDVVELVEHKHNGLMYTMTTVASYTYNAWGEILTATGTMASVNPLRYRGYYYDAETGFYYLQSRYYDPVMHRFINADSLTSTGSGMLGCNMFAYCNNNPVVLQDSAGKEPVETIDLDGDGEIDCYVYQYAYATMQNVRISRIGFAFIRMSVITTGYVCFFPNLSEKDFDNGVNLPEKYADSVLIGDLRKTNEKNPTMQLYESYRITRKSEMLAIIDTMLEYDEEYPSSKSWGRTKRSLLFEWYIHNLGYKLLDYKRARSTDFDRAEEGWTAIDYYKKFREA